METLDKQTVLGKERFNQNIIGLYVSKDGEFAFLDKLKRDFPYCQAIHLMLANVSEDYLHLAAFYMPNRSTLYNFVHQPEILEQSFSIANLQPSDSYHAHHASFEPTPLELQLEDGELDIENLEVPAFDSHSIEHSVLDLPVDESNIFLSDNDSVLTPDEANTESIVLEDEEELTFLSFNDGHDENYEDVTSLEIDDDVRDDRRDEIIDMPFLKEKSMSSADEVHQMSKYDDDTMPYTFLWWLNKTRREHANIRPYVANNKQNNFNSVEQIDYSSIRVESNPQDDIIDRFIQNHPKIQNTTKTVETNIENKAQKSTEDQVEFVSETLAQIYVEQMLYPKAIEAYKKLCLKFPEKSVYFVAIIEKLQKKLSKLNKSTS